MLGFVTMRWGICSLGVACAAGPARHGVCSGGLFCRDPLAPRFLGLSPLTPFFFAFVWSCVGVGFLAGCLPVFPLVFHGGRGVGLVNSVGLRGHLLGWRECVWVVSLFLVNVSTREG